MENTAEVVQQENVLESVQQESADKIAFLEFVK